MHVRLREEYFMYPRTDASDAYEMTHLHVLIANPHGRGALDRADGRARQATALDVF